MFTSPGHVADPGFVPFQLARRAGTSIPIHPTRAPLVERVSAEDALTRLGVAVASFDTIGEYWRQVEVPEDPIACHPWRGAMDAQGQGLFSVACEGTVPAHHFVYALAHDLTALQRAGDLSHRCGNPACQNPDHLTPMRFAA
jgi:hypothetical protein